MEILGYVAVGLVSAFAGGFFVWLVMTGAQDEAMGQVTERLEELLKANQRMSLLMRERAEPGQESPLRDNTTSPPWMRYGPSPDRPS